MKILSAFIGVWACLVAKTLGLSTVNRRDLFRRVGTAFVAASAGTASSTTFFVPPLPASAAVPTAEELSRLQKGHARVKYLLDNWDEVTKVCGKTVMTDTERRQVLRTNGGGGTDACIRTPLVVQDYLGYKSTTDPLFKVDKLMLKAAPLAGDNQDEYLDVVERYRENADQTAVLAYTSSWAGEENPNGSAENIENYLEQTHGFAIKTEELLRLSLKYLDLPVLPASAKP